MTRTWRFFSHRIFYFTPSYSATKLMFYLCRLVNQSQPTEDLKREEGPCSRLRLPSPTSNKRKQKPDKRKKFKKDPKKPQARLLQERCVHCHELYYEVISKQTWEKIQSSCRHIFKIFPQSDAPCYTLLYLWKFC